MAKTFEETKQVSTVRGFLGWKDGRNSEVVFTRSKKGNVVIHTVLKLIALLLLATSCVSYGGMGKCATYSYHDVGSDEIKTHTTASVLYLPGDTVVFYPEGRTIVINSITVGNTTLKQ